MNKYINPYYIFFSIGFLEIVCGCTCFPVLKVVFVQLTQITTIVSFFSTIILLFVISIYFSSIVAGALLIGRFRSGIILSIIVHSLQALSFHMGSTVYSVVVGVAFQLRLWPLIGFQFQFGSNASIWLSGQSSNYLLYLNLLSILLLVVLFNLLPFANNKQSSIPQAS